MRTAATFVPLCWRTTKKNRLYVRKYLQYQAKQGRNFISKVFLFQKMKTQLKGQRREDIADIQAETQAQLNSDTKRPFERRLQQWDRRWDHNERDNTDMSQPGNLWLAPPAQRFGSLLYFRHQLKGIFITCTLPDVQ